MSQSDDIESFPAMLRRVLGSRLKPGADTFIDMFAPDGVLDYPFAPPGLGTSYVGRDAIIENFRRIRLLLRVDSVADVAEIAIDNPNVVILEFSGRGEGLTTGQAYNQRYISVIHLRDGQIARYKDYWNPIAILLAVNGGEAMQDLTIN